MKKIALLSLVAIILSNCEISPRKTYAYYEMANFGASSSAHNAIYDYKNIHGMTYLVGTNYEGGLICVNITKDSLECEVLRRKLK